jgi:hypothetical protein
MVVVGHYRVDFFRLQFYPPSRTLTHDAEHRRKTTPVMKAGLTDHPWTLLELLQAASTH